MPKKDNDKLKHDFLNSMVIINSLAKSSSSFIEKIANKNATISDRQIELFKQSMKLIQDEIFKVEIFFNTALDQ